MVARPDSQQTELVGRSALETQLIMRGYEIARPLRDKGVDLIVYRDETAEPFVALPLQIKSYSGTTFGVWRKYEGRDDLIFAYIWNVLTSPRFFFLTYSEAATLIPEQQKQTYSWTREPMSQAGWTWTTAPKHVQSSLPPFENRWDWLGRKLSETRPPVLLPESPAS